MQNTVKQYKAILAKRNALSHAMGVLSYDSETAMPKNGAPHMAETMAILSEESYKLQVNDEVRALLEKLNANSESLDEITRREVEEELKQLKKLENVPIEEYAAYSRLISEASVKWREAKQTNEKYVPYVIEPSVGVERMLLMLLCDAYDEETLENGDVRNILHLHPAIAPYKAAVLPLQKNKLGDKAREIYSMLSKKFMVDYDDSGAIGKRYRRHDEIGTPMCITVDFDTLEDNTVTVRDRDTMEQIRMPIDQLIAHIEQECDF